MAIKFDFAFFFSLSLVCNNGDFGIKSYCEVKMNKSDVWHEVGSYGKQERTELSGIAFLGEKKILKSKQK